MAQTKTIFLLAFLAVALPFGADAAVLYLLPQAQQVYLGDSFVVEVRLDTEGEEINAAEANLKFPADLLEVVDVGMGGSVLNIAVNGKRADVDGSISFAGGAPEGFRGDGLVGRITFLAKGEGTASVNFMDDSRVLLNDGSGTPAPLVFLEGTYAAGAKPEGWVAISAPTHPNQNKWAQGNTLHLRWDLEKDAEYSYILSRDPLAEPDETPDRPQGDLLWMGDMEYAYLEDGIYYFHLRKGANDSSGQMNWGPKITYRAMVDATPPEDFQPQFARIEGKNYVVFNAFDKTSGVNRYEVLEQARDFWGKPKENSGNWKEGRSPYLLADQNLNSAVKIKAIDEAGNARMAEIIPPKKPLWQTALLLIIFAVLFIFAALSFRKKFQRKSA
ncbi:MAG: hypothetical protein A2667_01055 [Candidatus Wildermuthbacteria bacterium RIFCSPHIGHO2_01_FULL_47_27]|uniref:Cohesin domain-containing protein n=1 Tax=Candidatus Wildermuthbacteria bacterium RIFCSPHIGHO2_02_FULL_47_17 TaxID=1802452 RepID=A0A1G2R229_9BACT|nr:MAG: hypothetical protein UY15_C0022G0002 [Parcubacteria group bacterium GW2011_GWA2_47_9]OHA64345.1 MAG: hypothetical protein A2667_01055 [Candidatus Wildermuthbacteria bacterium RIFCSPHIGHO2_01_FULL_47_27]OHA66925.1 MAG: hypothetical protein A3D59_01705 [Candidatus Wildermuthbacteria bacterium RIFCSPHIGHO2_02_FULL_47_17]